MIPYQVKVNQQFVGRESEIDQLKKIDKSGKASVFVIYGRRRVGKTELIEQTYRNRYLIKIEGLENKSKVDQMKHVMYQLSRYLEDQYVANIQFTTWIEVFDFIADRFDIEKWTLYFEELQWLANYESDFVSEFKYAWDNSFRHKKNLIVVLCGSSPSFMINEVLHSKALYNRSTIELHLEEMSLKEVQLFLKNYSNREVMTAYLILGGIPEYLAQIVSGSSVLLSICQNSFNKDSYFCNEYERIFISSMSDNPHYKSIVEFLSKYKFSTRNEIAKHLKMKSGGSLTKLLDDLILCGFIEKYTPYQVDEASLLARYCISDAYLMFYFKFIKPLRAKIKSGVFKENPMQALKMEVFQKWIGFAFERFIRKNEILISKILGFSGVDYRSGVYFDRKTNNKNPNYQIDLIFERKDFVYTICEIKYYAGLVGADVVDEMERKLLLFENPKKYTIQKVLITTEGATKALRERNYFDKIIVLDDLFDEKYW